MNSLIVSAVHNLLCTLHAIRCVGISGQFPSEYVTAVVSGQALGGVFTAIVDIITITFATDPRNSAFTFFNIGNGLLALSLIAYVIVSRTAHFKYYTSEKPTTAKTSQVQAHRNEPVFRDVLNKMWLYGFTEWMVRSHSHSINLHSADKYTIHFWFILSVHVCAQQVFVATLCVYPSVTVLVSSESRGNGHPWNDVYFVPVTNYLIFNSGDYLGRILAGMLEWVMSDQIDTQTNALPLKLLLANYLHCLHPISYVTFCSRAISRVWLPSCRYSESHSFPAFCYATQFRGTHYPFSYIPTTFSF